MLDKIVLIGCEVLLLCYAIAPEIREHVGLIRGGHVNKSALLISLPEEDHRKRGLPIEYVLILISF